MQTAFSLLLVCLLFAGFLVPLRPKCAGLGNGCERFCALGSLLGSYVHQELTDVNNTNVLCCV